MSNNYIEINKAAYNILSQQYQSRSLNRSMYEENPEKLVDNVLNHFPQEKELLVLEIGPGSGDICKQFELRGHRTVAVELAENIAKIVRTNSPNTTVINANILDVNFCDGQFDIIYAGAVIHLFPQNDALILLHKINRWLKQNGVLFINTTISTQTDENTYSKLDYKGDVVRFRRRWREDDFTHFIGSCFSILKTYYTNEVDRNKSWIGFTCKPVINEI